MKMTLRKKYEIAVRGLWAVGCDHWARKCQKVLKRIGELGRLERERHDWYCRMLRRKREQGTWAMCEKCPRKKYEKCTGEKKP